MNIVTQLIEECTQRGIALVLEEGHVFIRPASNLPDDLRQRLRANKHGILAALSAAAQQPRGVTVVTEITAQNNKVQQQAQQPAKPAPGAMIRPVFTYVLRENAAQPYIMMGIIGQTVAEARASLYDRYGERLLWVDDYLYPPPGRVQ